MKEGADMRKKKNISKYLFVLPGFCFFAFAMLIPFCMGFHIAFTDWDGVGIKYNFVGLKNFQMIFQGYFLISVKVNQNRINLGVQNMCKAI